MTTLRSIELFLRSTGMPATRFGRQAMRDPRFVHDLRRGRQPSERTWRRVEHFMNIYGKNAVK